ncbi:MAG: PLP-dependent aminotransferase family protein [Acidobacteria bacterium]|nr:PLP-dependent aminotransferase family protein [Acidobacteriota bacterium]
MNITIDRTSRIPIYLQIVRQLRALILAGTLPAGTKLPPERRLARAIGVNRSTVLNAYSELKADALVESHVGRGTMVLPLASSPEVEDAGRNPEWRQFFRSETGYSRDPLIRDLLEMIERPDVVSLALGLPAPELVPLAAIQELLDRLLGEMGASLLLHCPTEGISPLRDVLSQWLCRRGIRCSPAEVLILSGSQQGLDLAARVFLSAGDEVVVEEPTYLGALQVFRSAGVRLVGIPMDDQGMRTDLLARILERRRPKLIYTLPTFQNPSGTVMGPERRAHLLRLAEEYNVPILEDDPYSELSYDAPPPDSLTAMDTGRRVMYLSTFSKILFPGLRVGWLVAPRAVIRQFALVKQSIDLHTNTPGQWLMERFLSRELVTPHLARVREAYRRRRDVMEETLLESPPPGFTWRKPAGGFYFWCRCPEAVERTPLFSHAVEQKVTFLPGWACFNDEPEATFIRLNFSYPQPEEIRTGIRRLMRVIAEVADQNWPVHRREAGTLPIV